MKLAYRAVCRLSTKMDEYRNLANSGQDSRTNHVKIDTVVVLVLIESTKTTTTAVITLA